MDTTTGWRDVAGPDHGALEAPNTTSDCSTLGQGYACCADFPCAHLARLRGLDRPLNPLDLYDQVTRCESCWLKFIDLLLPADRRTTLADLVGDTDVGPFSAVDKLDAAGLVTAPHACVPQLWLRGARHGFVYPRLLKEAWLEHDDGSWEIEQTPGLSSADREEILAWRLAWRSVTPDMSEWTPDPPPPQIPTATDQHKPTPRSCGDIPVMRDCYACGGDGYLTTPGPCPFCNGEGRVIASERKPGPAPGEPTEDDDEGPATPHYHGDGGCEHRHETAAEAKECGGSWYYVGCHGSCPASVELIEGGDCEGRVIASKRKPDKHNARAEVGPLDTQAIPPALWTTEGEGVDEGRGVERRGGASACTEQLCGWCRGNTVPRARAELTTRECLACGHEQPSLLASLAIAGVLGPANARTTLEETRLETSIFRALQLAEHAFEQNWVEAQHADALLVHLADGLARSSGIIIDRPEGTGERVSAPPRADEAVQP